MGRRHLRKKNTGTGARAQASPPRAQGEGPPPALSQKEIERAAAKQKAEQERQRRIKEEEERNKEIFLSALAQFDSSFGSYAAEKAVAREQRKVATKRINYASREHIEATLDLHGMKREQAARALDMFLADSKLKKRRCVLVIHGKGSGALREETQLLLTKDSRVASFTTAPAALGGEGALVVICRK